MQETRGELPLREEDVNLFRDYRVLFIYQLYNRWTKSPIDV